MTVPQETKPRWSWWRAHELRINIILSLLFVFLLLMGIAIKNGVVAGISLLLLMFFGVYAIYAYFRMDR